jgi:hypothetical protein
MAITHVKVTYSVQPYTAQRIQELATKWGVPKSEVIRRAVDGASRGDAILPHLTPVQALDRLSSTPSKITAAAARQFAREVQSSRRASGRKRGAEQDRTWNKYAKAHASRHSPR